MSSSQSKTLSSVDMSSAVVMVGASVREPVVLLEARRVMESSATFWMMRRFCGALRSSACSGLDALQLR